MTSADPRVLVIGRQSGLWPPGIPESETGARYVMADDVETVRRELASCEVVLSYGAPRDALESAWAAAERLRWVHVAAAGVDRALFPALVESDVIVTNSRGVFDTMVSEYVLALMLALAKDLPGTTRAQSAGDWRPRVLAPLAGGRVVIVGAGTLGRATGRLLRGAGLDVTLVGRTGRDGQEGEGWIHAVADLPQLLPAADWLVIAAPLTAETDGLIGHAELAALPVGARVVNIGRGRIVVEDALVAAIRSGRLAGAALDVFELEPLPSESPLWSLPTVLVSPHVAGSSAMTPEALTRSFLDNLRRYVAGEPLRDAVDKRLGYVPTVE